MAINGVYGDELTLRACTDICNVNIRVASTLGKDAFTVIRSTNPNPRGDITLEHFAEGQGIHYVTLWNQILGERVDSGGEVFD